MKGMHPIFLAVSLAVAGLSAAAQETPTIPPVLQITREFVKPYKGGMAHDKTESAFIAAMTRAKFPAHYVALNSLSGKARALFLTRYASFAEWEKDNKLADDNPVLSADLERAGLADGELLESVDSGVFTYDADLSYHPRGDLSHARFVEITVFKVKPGHVDDWRKLTKMVKEAHDKAGTSAHWATFEGAYGVDSDTYIVITGHKAMEAIDTEYSEEKKFRDALGEQGYKGLSELYGQTVEGSRSELFSINPKQSYVSEEWIKADPEFWKPKPPAMHAPKPATEPKKTNE